MLKKSFAMLKCLALGFLLLGCAPLLRADTVFFSDSFNRPDDLNLDSSTTGMAGILVSSGVLPANSVWVQPTDTARGNDTNSVVLSNRLKMGGQGNTVYVFPEINLASLLSNGVVSVSLDLQTSPTGTTGNGAAERYVGIGIGFGLAEGNAGGSGDRYLQSIADLFVDQSIDGQIRIYDGPAASRILNTPNSTVDLDPGVAGFVSGTLKVDLVITNTAAGATVSYSVRFNSNVVSTGRSFKWSGDKECYLGVEDRSSLAVTNDNFSVSAIGTYTPLPVNALTWLASRSETWDTSTTNWVDSYMGVTSYAFFAGANVTFNDTAKSSSVNVSEEIFPGNILINNDTSNYVFYGTGSLSGPGSLTKSGNGLLTLSLGNAFSGGVTLSGGRLRLGDDAAAGTGRLYLGGGALSSDSTTPRTLSNPLTITTASSLGNTLDNGTLTVAGFVGFNGAARNLTIRSDTVFAAGAGDGAIGSKLGSGMLTLKGAVSFTAPCDVQDGTLVFDGATVTSLDRIIPDTAGVSGIARLVVTNGASIVQSSTVGNLRSGRQPSSGTNYLDLAGLYSLPNASAANGFVTLQGDAACSEVTFFKGGDFTARGVTNNGGVGNTVFKFDGGVLRARGNSSTFFEGIAQALIMDGGANIDDNGFAVTINQNLLSGGDVGGLNKSGGGTLTLNGFNTYGGPTIIGNGCLNITGTLAGAGEVLVAGGALGGTGAIAGAVTVLPGGILAPGNALGTLTLQSNLTIYGGMALHINKSFPQASDFTQVNGLLANGGAGIALITNIGPAFEAGDIFRFFNKPLLNGDAMSISPARPAPGLAWTNLLAIDGSIGVVATGSYGTPADLVELTLSPGILSPSFNSNVFYYEAQVSYTNAAVRFTPVCAVPGATVQIMGARATNYVASGAMSDPIALRPGGNVINVRVTSPNGALVNDYTVLVTRARPNVVVILADDQGFSDWSCYGSEIQTPNLDGLAAKGLRFRNFYNAARCSPTRCALLTGLYTQQAATSPSASLPPLRTDNNVTMAELLGANGYRTYMSGKWHLGTGTGQSPEARGFQEVFTFASGSAHSADTWTPSAYRFLSTDGEATNITYAAGSFYQPDAIGDYCMQFLSSHYQRHTNSPFFLYVPFGSAHFPLQAPKSMVDANVPLYANGWDVLRFQRYNNMLEQGVIDSRYALSPNEGVPAPGPIPAWSSLASDRQADLVRRMAIYAAMVRKMDANVGRVVEYLRQQGQLDNTLILALSDNGGNYEGGVYGANGGISGATPLVGLALENMGLKGEPDIQLGGGWAHVSNTPFRLFKHFTHNGGIGTPCIIHWPQGLTRTNEWENQSAHLIDVMATVVEATGVAYPVTWTNSAIGAGYPVLPLQGVSLTSLFTNSAAGLTRNLGFEHEGNRAYISGSWKLVTKNYALYSGASAANELELYDLESDPCETTNLAYANLPVLTKLVTNWNTWCSAVGEPASLLLTAFSNPPAPLYFGSEPARTINDLFVDSFKRANKNICDASTDGMWGDSLTPIPPLGANAAYYEGYEGSGTATSIQVMSNSLWMAVGQGMSETGVEYNFTGRDLAEAGGFSVELNVVKISDDGTDSSNKYAGFGVGLNSAEAATGGDINLPLSPGQVAFRGALGGNTGACAFFVELDLSGNVKVWREGLLLDTVYVGQSSGLLTAAFACNGFTTNDSVVVSVFFNGRQLDINSTDINSLTQTFRWRRNNSNYIGLSARASDYVQLDNLAIRKLPLANGMITGYALSYGLTGADTDPAADPDKDGVSNLGEWAFGGSPTIPDSFLARLSGAQLLPGNDFQFEFQRLRHSDAFGLRYRYFVSADLNGWTEATPVVLAANSNEDKPGYEAVTLKLPAFLTANSEQLFLRVLAEIAN